MFSIGPELGRRSIDVVEILPQGEDQLRAHQLPGVRRNHSQHEDAVFPEKVVREFSQSDIIGHWLGRMIAEHTEVLSNEGDALAGDEHNKDPVCAVEHSDQTDGQEPEPQEQEDLKNKSEKLEQYKVEHTFSLNMLIINTH